MNEARDRLLDALLAQHLGERGDAMERRYARAFAALDAADKTAGKTADAHHFGPSANARGDSDGAAPKHPLRLYDAPPATRRRRARLAAMQYARAALLALAAGMVLLLLPIETNAAMAVANAASAEARAATTAADRRYAIEVLLPERPGMSRPRTLRGTWDLRGDESRLELKPDGMPALVRVDAHDGAWEMRDGSQPRRLESRALWPRWIEGRDGSIAVERMDDLLRLVQRNYAVALARGGSESPETLRGALHIVASRRDPVPGPDEIDLWIDTARGVVLEAWLRWDMPPRHPGDAPPSSKSRPPAPRDGMPPRNEASGRGAPPPRPPRDDYRFTPGALPPEPPEELRLRRIEPIEFPPNHFAHPGA